MGAIEFLLIKALPEADGGRFQESATLTQRRLAIDPEIFEMRLRISALITALAFDQRIGAVEFNQPVRAGAGKAMEAINVLRDDAAEFSRPFQTDDGIMNGVRPGVAEGISPFELVIPMLYSRRFRGHEILVVDRLSARPDTLRTAKIRNPAARGNAGAGEDERLLRSPEVVGKSHPSKYPITVTSAQYRISSAGPAGIPRIVPNTKMVRNIWGKMLKLGAVAALGAIGVICYAAHAIQKQSGTTVFSAPSDLPYKRVALVLGCSPVLGNGQPNWYFNHRIQAAAELFKAGKVEYLLLSGDNHTVEYDEPTAMKEALIRLGVPEKRLVLDYAGFSTSDSVVRAKQIFGLTEFCVVSQKDHAMRAVYIARQKGIAAVGFAARDIAVRHGWRTRIRESLARVRTLLDVHLWNRKPHFGGPRIEIGDEPEPAGSGIASKLRKAPKNWPLNYDFLKQS